MRNNLLATLILVVFLNSCTTVTPGPIVGTESRAGPPVGSNLIVVPESRSPLGERLELVLYEENICDRFVKKTYKELGRKNLTWDLEDTLKKRCSENPILCPLAVPGYFTLLPMAILIYPFLEKRYADVETGGLIESDWEKESVVSCGRVPVTNAEVDISIPSISLSAKGQTDSGGRVVLGRSGPGVAEILQAAAAASDEVTVEVGFKGRTIRLRLSKRDVLDQAIDMSPGTPELAAYPVATFSLGDGRTNFEAGKTTNLVIEVSNKGKGETSQLKAVIESPDPLLNGRELLFGKVLPGKPGVWVEPVQVPLLEKSRNVPIRILFSERNGYVPEEIHAKLAIKERGRPTFVYTLQVIDGGNDTSVGNGDGRIQKAESVDLMVFLKNTGTEEARNIRAQLNFSKPVREGLRLKVAEQTTTRLGPDQTVPLRFNVDVLRSFAGSELPLQLEVRETQFGAELRDRIVLPIDQPVLIRVIELRQYIKVKTLSGALYSGAGPDTTLIGRVRQNTVLLATGEFADWYRIQWGNGRLGWVSKHQVEPFVEGAKESEKVSQVSEAGIIEVFRNSPPVIALASPAREQVVEEEKVTLRGTIVDQQEIREVAVEINGQRLRADFVEAGLRRLGPNELELNLPVSVAKGRNVIKTTATNSNNQKKEEIRNVSRVEGRGPTGKLPLLEAMSDVDRYILSPTRLPREANERLWAVIIGIERYSRTIGASFARRDAYFMYEYARKLLGIPPENIFVLIDDDATKSALQVLLEERLPRRVKKGDKVFVFYAGHGISDPQNRQLYLLPTDADPQSIQLSGYNADEFYRALARLEAEQVVVLLDACFTGTVGRHGELQSLVPGTRPLVWSFDNPAHKYKNLVVISAGQNNQVSNSDPEMGHGLFTYYLLKGLMGEADVNRDGRVVLTELAAYVKEAVDRRSRQLYGQTRDQTPVLFPAAIETELDVELVRR